MMKCVIGLSWALGYHLAGSVRSKSPAALCGGVGQRFRGLSDSPAHKRIRSRCPRQRTLQRDRVLIAVGYHDSSDIYSPPKTPACQPLWALPVMSDMTCFDVGALVERIRRHVFAGSGGFVAAVGHLADDRDVVIDPYAARLDLTGGALSAEHVRRPRRGCQSVGVSLASSRASSSVSNGSATRTGPNPSSCNE